MNACDALLTEVSARSFPELSLSPCFVRRWPSLYEAFDDAKINDAKINRPALQRLFSATPLFCNTSFLQHLFVEAALEQTRPRSASTGSPSAGTRPERTRLVLAADSTPLVRAQSPTARDRTYVHVPNLPAGAKPVLPGWQ